MAAAPSALANLNAFGIKATHFAGLSGSLYDLKQSPKNEPFATSSESVAELRKFAKSWDPEILKKFFKAKTELFSQRIFFPELSASEATKAFGVEDTVKPSLWVIHYKGRVMPQKTGEFRFRGGSSDWMLVRFGEKNVFDGGLGSAFVLDGDVNQKKSAWIPLVSGKTYPVEILIGNYPGGSVYAFLQMEEKGARYEQDERGEPILPLFQIGKLPVPKFGPEAKRLPAIAADPVVFMLSR